MKNWNIMIVDDPATVVISTEQDRQANEWAAIISGLVEEARRGQVIVRFVYHDELTSLSKLPVPGWPLGDIIASRVVAGDDYLVGRHSFDFLSSDPKDMYFIIKLRDMPPGIHGL